MKQLYLFNPPVSDTQHGPQQDRSPSIWTLYIDGAARNNPGPAGAGIYLLKDNETVSKEGFFLGIKTNNQAEYLALLLGLLFLKQYMHPGDKVRIVSDSELLVKQLNRVYKVRHPALQPMHKLAQTLIEEIGAQIMHVVRSDNVQADKMANYGIDKKKPVPQAFIKMLSSHGISI